MEGGPAALFEEVLVVEDQRGFLLLCVQPPHSAVIRCRKEGRRVLVPGEAVDRAGVVLEQVDAVRGALDVLTIPQSHLDIVV